MARITLDEKIKKNNEAISKEKRNISNARQRLKRLEETQKKLDLQLKEKEIQDMISKLAANGINTPEQLENLLAFTKSNNTDNTSNENNHF